MFIADLAMKSAVFLLQNPVKVLAHIVILLAFRLTLVASRRLPHIK